MHVELRIREVDAVLGQLLVELLIHVIEHLPVVGNLGAGEGDAALGLGGGNVRISGGVVSATGGGTAASTTPPSSMLPT